MKRARGDEQHVVRLDRAVLGVDGAALDQRQQIALYAFAGYVGSRRLLAARDLVDFIDEYDAILFGVGSTARSFSVLFVDHLGRFVIDQRV